MNTKGTQMRKFNMYDVLKDKVTGFSGTVLAITDYATGCTHYSLQRNKLPKDGKVPDWESFDQSRLELVKAAKAEKSEKPTGGPAPKIRQW